MTRKELRDYVDEQRTRNNIPYHVYSALVDGIDTLEQEPYESDEVKKIDAWKIKERIAELWIVKDKLQVHYIGTIHNIPLSSVTPQPKIGRWIKIITDIDFLGNETYHHRCSECSRTVFFGTEHYCPSCGAKMVESEG